MDTTHGGFKLPFVQPDLTTKGGKKEKTDNSFINGYLNLIGQLPYCTDYFYVINTPILYISNFTFKQQ